MKYGYLQANNLHLSVPKCRTTLLTSDNHQSSYHPKIFINNSQLPLNKMPKLLGVSFDTHFTFRHHVNNINSKAKSRLNILKALTGKSWGQEKETILLTYQTIIRPLLNYAVPIWTPPLANTHTQKLQIIQNSALRIATGCTLATNTDLLHQETSILPVEAHNTLLSTQALIQLHNPNHPNHSHLHNNELTHPKRQMKHNIISRHTSNIIPPPSSLTLDTHTLRATLATTHTHHVTQSIASLCDNPVLKSKPPAISSTEQSLPRPHRTLLAQHRSNSCPRLNQYQHFLLPSTPNIYARAARLPPMTPITFSYALTPPQP